MRTATKTVYYCEHCGRHRLTAGAITGHEPYCTLNPNRRCRWHDDKHDLRLAVAHLRDAAIAVNLCDLDGRPTGETRSVLRSPDGDEAVAWVHDHVDGCPACMLAALRQSGVDYQEFFNYEAAVVKFREEEQEEAAEEEYREFTRGLL